MLKSKRLLQQHLSSRQIVRLSAEGVIFDKKNNKKSRGRVHPVYGTSFRRVVRFLIWFLYSSSRWLAYRYMRRYCKTISTSIKYNYLLVAFKLVNTKIQQLCTVEYEATNFLFFNILQFKNIFMAL